MSPRRIRRLTWKQWLAVGAVVLGLVAGSGLTFLDADGPAWTGTASLLPDDEVPSVLSVPDPRPVELGLRFRVDEPVEAVAVQYYRGPDNRGPHQATLWSGDGRRLADTAFEEESPTGLQTARFADAVLLQPGEDYVVSYTAPGGRYSVDARYFRHAVARGPLSARPDAGVYTYRPGTFPTESYDASGYTVDVVVRAPGSSSEPPTQAASPAPGPTDTTSTATETAGPSTVFPTEETAGVPAGWEPRRTVEGTYVVSKPGAVVEDLRVNGSIEVAADDVTLRRVEVVGGSIGNWSDGTCTTGLRLERVSVISGPGQDTAGLGAAISTGGYTADRVKIDGLPEGFRVGGLPEGCGPVVVRNSWTRVVAPENCDGIDWHGDGIQGWEGAALTVRDSVFVLEDSEACMGTAPFFYPDQGNASVDIDGLLVQGGGYSFRLGTPGTVRNLNVVEGSSWFGPVEVTCDLVSAWDARLVRLDRGQPVALAELPCNPGDP